MYPNLNAEQARYGDSDEVVSKLLCMSRASYNTKKKKGKFDIEQAAFLCNRYVNDINYLFSKVPLNPTSWKPIVQEES